MKVFDVNEVIDKAGGTRMVADALGSTTSAIRKWRCQGYVPGLRVMDVAELAGLDPRQIPRRAPKAAPDAPADRPDDASRDAA